MDGQWGTLRCRRSLAAAHASLSEPSTGPAASWCAAGRLLATWKCERQRTYPTHDENTAPESHASAPLSKVVIVRSRAPQLG